MSTKEIETGGPAFPRPAGDYNGTRNGNTGSQQGMSLRDWYAGLALQGLMSNPQTMGIVAVKAERSGTEGKTFTALACFEMADAMLAARKNGGAA